MILNVENFSKWAKMYIFDTSLTHTLTHKHLCPPDSAIEVFNQD